MDYWLITVHAVQILFYLFSLALAFYTLIVKRNEIFRNTLQNKQIEELGRLRAKLFDVWFNIYHVKGYADNIRTLNGSVADFQKEQPENWEQYQQYKNDSLELFYKLSFENYYLFPPKFERNKVSDLRDEMNKFVPFTIMNLIDKDSEEIKHYQDLLLKTINYFDTVIKNTA
jgi:hypothetical protein